MEKLNLHEYNDNEREFAITSQSTDCTCLECGACLWCAVFPPLVGVVLGVALGPLLTSNKNGS